MSIKHAPVVIRLHEKEIHRADLMKELAVDKHRMGKMLLEQPGRYGWWSALYSEVASKVEILEIRLEEMYSDLAKKYMKESGGKIKLTELKFLIVGTREYQKLRRRLWRWRSSEQTLKGAVRAFDHRLNALQSYAADQRKEKESDPKVGRSHEER